MRIRLILASLIVLSQTSYALALGPSGEFQGRGEGKLFLSISKMNNIEIVTTTGNFGCGGSFVAKGKMIAARIMQAQKYEMGKMCTITIYFDEKFKSISTQEDDCVAFHGAACGFNGVLKRKK